MRSYRATKRTRNTSSVRWAAEAIHRSIPAPRPSRKGTQMGQVCRKLRGLLSLVAAQAPGPTLQEQVPKNLPSHFQQLSIVPCDACAARPGAPAPLLCCALFRSFSARLLPGVGSYARCILHRRTAMPSSWRLLCRCLQYNCIRQRYGRFA